MRLRQTLAHPSVLATLVVAVLVLGGEVMGPGIAATRVSPNVEAALARNGQVNVRVVLTVPPEAFNLSFLQQAGVVGSVNGRTIVMDDVTAQTVWSIASQYWVERIELPR